MRISRTPSARALHRSVHLVARHRGDLEVPRRAAPLDEVADRQLPVPRSVAAKSPARALSLRIVQPLAK